MDHPENSVPDFTPLGEIDYQPLPPPHRRSTLDALKCSCGECDNTAADGPMAWGASPCHRAPLYVEYFDGILAIKCSVCRADQMQIEVAK